jgi:hypothetical protein
MKSINIPIASLLTPLSSEVQYNNTMYIKGQTSIVFVFSSFIGNTYPVTNIAISWGDNTPVVYMSREIFYNYRVEPIIDEVLYGRLGGDVLLSSEHTFTNDTQSYGVQYTTEVIVTRVNGTTVTVFTPIVVFWDSYYDTIKDLKVINTQITPAASSLTFANLEIQEDKQVLPAILGTASTPLKTYQ